MRRSIPSEASSSASWAAFPSAERSFRSRASGVQVLRADSRRVHTLLVEKIATETPVSED